MNEIIRLVLLAGAGGAIGSMLRFISYLWIEDKISSSFPYATFIVNVAGCLLIGILTGLQVNNGISAAGKVFWIAGVCGGFTTFSAFSKENLQLLQNGQILMALAYTSASVILCLSVTAGGFYLVSK